MNEPLADVVESVLGVGTERIERLSGGSVGDVYLVILVDGGRAVLKYDKSGNSGLYLEGQMLQYLEEQSHIPVPKVLYKSPTTLILEWMPGRSVFGQFEQMHAAELLSNLHNISGDSFGFEWDTVIGGLHQPNQKMGSWLDFFRERRLLYMAQQAVDHRRLPIAIMERIVSFVGQLDSWLLEPEAPSLLHGDAWTGNMLAQDGRITAFLDPAIYFGDAEIELAFTRLFGTFGQPFFERYQELRPLKAGFFEIRSDIYNLYPLLVHVRLFGGGYVAQVDATLRKFGY